MLGVGTLPFQGACRSGSLPRVHAELQLPPHLLLSSARANEALEG